MVFKKILASVLFIATVAGCAGCENGFLTKKKNISGIEDTMESYADALRDIDTKGVLELTDWDRGDKEYKQTALVLNPDTQNVSVNEFYKEIAYTISIDYSSSEIVIDGDEASVKVKYVFIDWEEVLDRYKDTGDLDQAVKDTDDTVTVKGKISFVLDNNEWKISKITNLDEVFSFYGCFRETLPDPVETEPVETETTVTETTGTKPDMTDPSVAGTTETAFADSYDKAFSAYIAVLNNYMDAIRLVEEDYDLNPVGLYDIDGNGLPELYFIADAGDDYSAVLHVFEYKEYMGEADEVVTVPNILAQGQASGSYMIYASDRELVVTYTYGESYFYHVESEIFTLANSDGSVYKWDKVARYAREIYTDYDPETDTENTTKVYYLHDYTIEESQYLSGMNDIVSRTKIVLGRRFNLSSNDPEYKLISKPAFSLLSFDMAFDYLSNPG